MSCPVKLSGYSTTPFTLFPRDTFSPTNTAILLSRLGFRSSGRRELRGPPKKAASFPDRLELGAKDISGDRALLLRLVVAREVVEERLAEEIVGRDELNVEAMEEVEGCLRLRETGGDA